MLQYMHILLALQELAYLLKTNTTGSKKWYLGVETPGVSEAWKIKKKRMALHNLCKTVLALSFTVMDPEVSNRRGL